MRERKAKREGLKSKEKKRQLEREGGRERERGDMVVTSSNYASSPNTIRCRCVRTNVVRMKVTAAP